MKSFFRFLLHNRLYSLINFFGLSLSLAFTVIVLSYTCAQYRVSKSVPDSKDIYAIARDGQAMMSYGISERLVGLPEADAVSMFTSPTPDNICEFEGSKVLSEVMSADKEFFGMFGIRFKAGSAENFTPSGVLISESFAKKIAGGTDPCGKQMILNGDSFRIDGIFMDFRKGLLPRADIIMNADAPSSEISMYKQGPLRVFGNLQVFIRTAPGTAAAETEEKINGLFSDIDYIGGHLSMIRADKLYFSESNLVLNKGNIQLIRNMIAAVLVLTLLALLNYINLNTALVSKRAKEMATRRIIGAGRGEILLKYISESVIFTAACFLTAIVLAAILTPLVGKITMDPEAVSSSALFSTSDIFLPENLAICLVACILTGIIAGIFPAVAAYRISPIDTVKGGLRRVNKRSLSKLFIVVQNVISITLIAMAITMEFQTRHLVERPAGCDCSDILYLDCSSYFEPGDYNVLMEKLRELPCVSELGICNGIPGNVNTSYELTAPDGKIFQCHLSELDTTAFRMLKFNILRQTQPCIPGTIWLSENTVRLLGASTAGDDLSEAIAGRNNWYGNIARNGVCGVVSDFIINDPGNTMSGSGAAISIVDDLEWKSFVIRTNGDHDSARKMISEAYSSFCRKKWGIDTGTYTNVYMDDMIRERNAESIRSLRLTELLMALSILLSLSGLVAVSIHYTESYAKSIALHKVFGASTADETLRNLKMYFAITAAACLLALPAAVILCRRYLEGFSYRIDLSVWIFVGTVLFSLAITFVSVIFQVKRAAGANPIDALRKE